MPRSEDGGTAPANMTYFYDFLTIVEADYPHASLLVILEEIAFAREVPAAARLVRDGDIYTLTMHIGFGHKAIVELEPDRHGKLQPVMGAIIKD